MPRELRLRVGGSLEIEGASETKGWPLRRWRLLPLHGKRAALVSNSAG